MILVKRPIDEWITKNIERVYRNIIEEQKECNERNQLYKDLYNLTIHDKKTFTKIIRKILSDTASLYILRAVLNKLGTYCMNNNANVEELFISDIIDIHTLMNIFTSEMKLFLDSESSESSGLDDLVNDINQMDIEDSDSGNDMEL